MGPSCAPCATQRILQGCGEGCRGLWVVAAWSPGVRARRVSEHLRTLKHCWDFLGKPRAHSGTALGGSSSPADGLLQAAVTALPAPESELERGWLTSSAFCRPLKSLGGAAPLGGGEQNPEAKAKGSPGVPSSKPDPWEDHPWLGARSLCRPDVFWSPKPTASPGVARGD